MNKTLLKEFEERNENRIERWDKILIAEGILIIAVMLFFIVIR